MKGDFNHRHVDTALLPGRYCLCAIADVIEGGADNDLLAGNEGDDRIYANSVIDVAAAIAAGGGTGPGLQGESLAGETGQDIVIGGDGNDIIDGGNGNNLIVTAKTKDLRCAA